MDLEAREHLRRQSKAKEEQLERDSESDQQPLCEAKEKPLQRDLESDQQSLGEAKEEQLQRESRSPSSSRWQQQRVRGGVRSRRQPQ